VARSRRASCSEGARGALLPRKDDDVLNAPTTVCTPNRKNSASTFLRFFRRRSQRRCWSETRNAAGPRHVFPEWKTQLGADDSEIVHLLDSERGESVHATRTNDRAVTDFVPISRVPRSDRERSHPAFGFHSFGPPWVGEASVGIVRYFYDLRGTRRRVCDHL